jgi:exopolyphosphatase/guanosine-5'-triphosphate,3'-diphosphate pyrophosphatase
MRLGVLDVGSNTVHLLVVDAHPGARPLPAYSLKHELLLAELLDGDRVSPNGADRLVRALADAAEAAADRGVEDVVAFATSAIREARNVDDVLERVREKTDVDLHVLPGDEEARLTFLAVRRWFGWSAGRLLVLDIGGGSLEVAVGCDEQPDGAVSLPLGAGRLTRARRWRDRVPKDELRAVRREVRTELARHAHGIAREGVPDRVVATSKTFRSLARIAGASPSTEGIYVPRTLSRAALPDIVERLAGMTAAERASLPGVSPRRAPQLVAGAVVAHAALDLFDVEVVDICPWALREGVILRRLDALAAASTEVHPSYRRPS